MVHSLNTNEIGTKQNATVSPADDAVVVMRQSTAPTAR